MLNVVVLLVSVARCDLSKSSHTGMCSTTMSFWCTCHGAKSRSCSNQTRTKQNIPANFSRNLQI